MILNWNPDDIPNWSEPEWADNWRVKRTEWWVAHGYDTVELPLPNWSLDVLLCYLAADAKAPVILGGKSPRGAYGHCVVVYEGKVIDPHPSRAGVVDPDESYAWNNVINLLVPRA
jgi:hypothetical protein